MAIDTMPGGPHGAGVAASPWVQRWGPVALQSLRAGGRATPTVLDLACGGGRHTHWFAAQGARATAVDRDAAATQALHNFADVVVADIEAGPWPLDQRVFDVVVVTNYLWRPLWPAVLASVAPGGWLIYETFGIGQAQIGKPSNPAFLLQPGELFDAVRGSLRVVAYEDGFLDAPPRFVQRIAATREPPAAGAAPSRHALAGP